MERSMERESLSGLTKALILAISMTTTLRVAEFMSGLMEGYTMETGKTTRCRATVPSLGQMEESM